MMPPTVKMVLTWLARDSPDREICGFILEPAWEVYPVRNVSDGGHEFEMDHEETKKVFENWYDDIIGVYHSHPGGSIYPSWEDVVNAPAGFRYFIVTRDEVAEWKIEGDYSVERVLKGSEALAEPLRFTAEEVRQGVTADLAAGKQRCREADQATPGPGQHQREG